jgi:hypothetical protein
MTAFCSNVSPSSTQGGIWRKSGMVSMEMGLGGETEFAQLAGIAGGAEEPDQIRATFF